MAIACGLASNDVMDRLGAGLAGIESNVLHDGHERLAKLLEGFFGLPEVDDFELVAGTDADMVEPSWRVGGACGLQPANGFVVLAGSHGCRGESEADSQGSSSLYELDNRFWYA